MKLYFEEGFIYQHGSPTEKKMNAFWTELEGKKDIAPTIYSWMLDFDSFWADSYGVEVTAKLLKAIPLFKQEVIYINHEYVSIFHEIFNIENEINQWVHNQDVPDFVKLGNVVFKKNPKGKNHAYRIEDVYFSHRDVCVKNIDAKREVFCQASFDDIVGSISAQKSALKQKLLDDIKNLKNEIKHKEDLLELCEKDG